MPDSAFERYCPLKPKFTRDGRIISATSGGLSAEHLGQKVNHPLSSTMSDRVVLREDLTLCGGLLPVPTEKPNSSFLPSLWILPRPGLRLLRGFTSLNIGLAGRFTTAEQQTSPSLKWGREGRGKDSYASGVRSMPGTV